MMSRRDKSTPKGGGKPNSGVAALDAFSNPLFRLGYGSQSPLEATEYPLTRMTDNYALLNSLYAQYPGAVSTVMWTTDEYAKQIQTGNFVLFAEDGVVKVMQDINTLTTYTQDIGEIYRYNRTMRLCNTIANDIFKQFSASFIGQVNNNEQGRARFQAAIVGYLQQIQDNQGIQNFTPEDVEVLPGTAIDAIVVNVAIQAVGSVEKIYMTVEVS